MREFLMGSSEGMGAEAGGKTDAITRVLSPKAMRTVRLAIAAVLGLQAMAASWDAAAQAQGPVLTVYPDPIGWGHLPNSPGGGGWFWGGGNRYETYIVDPWVPVPVEKVACEQWDNNNPKPTTCSGPPPDVSANGCGPAGLLSIIGALYPDSFFSYACDVHDICYSQPYANQYTCDNNMLDNMMRICNYAFGCEPDRESGGEFCNGTPAQKAECVIEASRILRDFYQPAFKWVIDDRFRTLQRQAECRVWHNARANESDCEHP